MLGNVARGTVKAEVISSDNGSSICIVNVRVNYRVFVNENICDVGFQLYDVGILGIRKNLVKIIIVSEISVSIAKSSKGVLVRRNPFCLVIIGHLLNCCARLEIGNVEVIYCSIFSDFGRRLWRVELRIAYTEL